MKVLLRKCRQGHSDLFEWSVTGKTWFKINYKRIVAVPNGDADPVKALQPFRTTMTKMRKYGGFFISVFEADYDRENKVLRLEKK